MKIFGVFASISAYSSLGILFVCMIISLTLAMNTFGIGRFYKKFNNFCKKIGIYFCLPLYGFSFVFEGIAEKIVNRNPILSFVLAFSFFLTAIILINCKKIFGK